MKKMFLTVAAIVCALTITATAAEKKKREVSAEEKALIEKYDANKDGKLDKDEMAKMTPDDKEALGKLHPKKKK